MNWFVGTYAGVNENFVGAERIGSNLSVYMVKNGKVFMGNQYVKTFGVAKIAKGLGVASSLLGLAVDGYGVYTGAVTVKKFGFDLGATGIGLFGGPAGALFATRYQ